MATRLLELVLRRRRATPTPATVAQLEGAVAELIAQSYGNITNMADFDAAIAQRAKSSTLIGAIIDFALRGAFLDFEETSACMLPLLDERGLTGEHLLSMTRAMRYGYRGDVLMLAICGHALAGVDVLTAALRNAGRDTTTLVAVHTGSLLPAAIGWVRANRVAAAGPSYPVADWHQQVSELTAEWTTWCAGDPTRTAFLTHHWSDFTTTDELFAVGAALVSAPAGP